MELGDRHHGAASARIRLCPGLGPRLQASTRELCDLRVQAADRGRGAASALLRKVCEEADAAGVLLVLFVDPFDDGPLDASSLAAWYARAGFEEVQTVPVRMMARQIGATPRVLGVPSAQTVEPRQ